MLLDATVSGAGGGVDTETGLPLFTLDEYPATIYVHTWSA
jgi:hypothetical protein